MADFLRNSSSQASRGCSSSLASVANVSLGIRAVKGAGLSKASNLIGFRAVKGAGLAEWRDQLSQGGTVCLSNRGRLDGEDKSISSERGASRGADIGLPLSSTRLANGEEAPGSVRALLGTASCGTTGVRLPGKGLGRGEDAGSVRALLGTASCPGAALNVGILGNPSGLGS